MAQKTHKSLQSTFAAPQRGDKLQGLLTSPNRTPADQTAVADPANGPHSFDDSGSPRTGGETSSNAGSSPAETVSSGTALVAAAEPAAGQSKPAEPESGTTSVYLRPKAYRELVDRRQKKFRSYAQTVYDAFAFIRDQAKDAQKDPTKALAELFEIGDAEDPWLMAEPRSARNAAEPTVEAKIAFKPHERQWVKERMAQTGATHLSPFLATVLEHYLLRAKN
jgi:hypothetical protein